MLNSMLRAALGALLAVAASHSALAQKASYPVKPIRMIVGFAAGGGTDLLSRILAVKMAEALGQPVIIDNRAGAGGTIAAEIMALAKTHPGELNYGSSGQGAISRLAIELFKLMAGVDLTHVPYKGTAPVLTDLFSGQIQFTAGAIIREDHQDRHRQVGQGRKSHQDQGMRK